MEVNRDSNRDNIDQIIINKRDEAGIWYYKLRSLVHISEGCNVSFIYYCSMVITHLLSGAYE